MNRREFLKAIGQSTGGIVAIAASLGTPMKQTTDLERENADLLARIADLEEALEIERASADTWYEEYWQADEELDAMDAEADFWYTQYEQCQPQDNLTVEIDGEWDGGPPRIIWNIGDQFTDGTTTGTLAEVLDA